MNIVFMGTAGFGVASAQAIVESGRPICAVVTGADKPQGRGLHLLASPVKQWAQAHAIPVLQPVKLREPQFVEQLRAYAPDLVVVVAFRILPPEVFTMPPLGAFNLHASLLPRYRGAAPIQWALIRGERETGVTTFFLKEQVDTGNILVQEKIPVGERETFGELHDRLAALGAAAVVRTVEMIEKGIGHAKRQNDALATPAPKITKEICRIDWCKPAREIHNLVRALAPAPGAFTTLNGALVKIFCTAPDATARTALAPGTCAVEGSRLFAGTGAGTVELLELQREGRARTTAANFIQGRNVKDRGSFV